MSKIKTGSIVVNPTDLLQGGAIESIIDRGMHPHSNSPITWTGSQIQFADPIQLRFPLEAGNEAINQILAANSPLALSNGQVLVAKLSRTTGTTTLTAGTYSTLAAGQYAIVNVSSLTAVNLSSKDHVILFKRVDTSTDQLLYIPISKQVLKEGQTVQLGASGSGSSSGSGTDIPIPSYQWLEVDDFDDVPGSSDSKVVVSNYTNAVYDASKTLFKMSVDKSKTVSSNSGTAFSVGSGPSFTVAPGDIVYMTSGARVGQFRRIQAVISQLSYTLESAFTGGNASGGDTVMISQAVWSMDLVNFGSASDKTRARDQYSGNVSQIAIDYFDSLTISDDVPDFVNTANVVVSSSNSGLLADTGIPDSSTFTPIFTRQPYPAEIEDYILSVNTNQQRLFLVFFPNPSNGSVTAQANLLRYECNFFIEDFAINGGVLDSAFCNSNGSGTELDCFTPFVVGGVTRVQLNWSYVQAVNPGTTKGQLRVILDGDEIPRFVAGSTNAPYYKEITTSGTGLSDTIEFSSDLSGSAHPIQVIKSEGIIRVSDASDRASTSLDNLVATSINQDMIADADGVRNQGSFTKRWGTAFSYLNDTEAMLIRSAGGAYGDLKGNFSGIDVFLRSRDDAPAGNTIGILIQSSDLVTGNTKDVIVQSGNATSGNSADVTVKSGTASGGRGKVILDGLYIDATSKKIKNVDTPVDPGDAVNKSYADSIVGGGGGSSTKMIGGGTFTWTYHDGISQLSQDNFEMLSDVSTNSNVGQTFLATSTRDIAGFQIQVCNPALATGSIVLSLYATDGSQPVGAALQTTNSIDVSTLPTTPGLFNFQLSSPYTVGVGVEYAFVIHRGIDLVGEIDIYYSDANPYADGHEVVSTNDGTTWSVNASNDLMFNLLPFAELSFTANALLEFPGLDYTDNTIDFTTQSPITLLNPFDAAYVAPNVAPAGPSLVVTVDTLPNVPTGAVIIARRDGSTNIIVGTSSMFLAANTSGALYKGLDPSAIASNLIPNAANTFDNGSTSDEWANVYSRNFINPIAGTATKLASANGTSSGNLNVNSGDASGGGSGNINIKTGTATTTRGNVNIDGTEIHVQNGPLIIDWTAASSYTQLLKIENDGHTTPMFNWRSDSAGNNAGLQFSRDGGIVAAIDNAGNVKGNVFAPGLGGTEAKYAVNFMTLQQLPVTMSAPGSGFNNLYFKNDNQLYMQNHAGVETLISTGGGSTFSDSSFRIQDNGDATKQLAFEVSGIATTTTRTITVPDLNLNLSTTTSGTFATNTLSNLGTTSINAALVPTTDNTVALGTVSHRWTNLFLNTSLGIGSNNEFLIRTSTTTPSGASGVVGIDTESLDRDIAVYTANNGSNNSTRTFSVRIETGNKTSGTGNSGDISFVIGTSSGGTRGKIQFKDGSEGTAGYVWTSTDTTGKGTWMAAGGGGGGGGATTALDNLVTTNINQNFIGNTGATWVIKTQNDTVNSQNVEIRSGDSSGDTSGGILITSGTAGSGKVTGDIDIGTGISNGTNSGSVYITSGNITGAGDSGDLNLISGNAPGGLPGYIEILQGDFTSVDDPSGIDINAGNNTGSGNGAYVSIVSGQSTGGGNGGDVTVQSPLALGGGVSGNVIISTGNNGTADANSGDVTITNGAVSGTGVKGSLVVDSKFLSLTNSTNIKTSGTAPGVVGGSGAGSSPSPSILAGSTDTAGQVSVGVDTDATSSDLIDVTFNTPFPTGSFVVITSADGGTADEGKRAAWFVNCSNTGFQISSFNNVTTGATYTWNYMVIGY